MRGIGRAQAGSRACYPLKEPLGPLKMARHGYSRSGWNGRYNFWKNRRTAASDRSRAKEEGWTCVRRALRARLWASTHRHLLLVVLRPRPMRPIG